MSPNAKLHPPGLGSRIFAASCLLITMIFAIWYASTWPPLATPHSPTRPTASVTRDDQNALLLAMGNAHEGAEPLAQALATISFKRRAQRFEHLGASLATNDPKTAFHTLADLDIPADREALVKGIFRTLATGDPFEAMLAAKHLNNKGEEDAALVALLEVWIGPGNYGRAREPRQEFDHREAWLGEKIGADGKHTDLLALWAKTLVTGQDRAGLLGLAAREEYSQDPVRAESYGAELTGSDRAWFNLDLMRAKPCGLAWQESSTLADPKARIEAQEMLIELWSNEAKPTIAAARFLELPDDQQSRNLLLHVAASYGQYGNNDAWSWVDNFVGQEAVDARRVVAMYTPTIYGATFTADSEGHPMVVSAVNSGNITLRFGDRVLAIGWDVNSPLAEVQSTDAFRLAELAHVNEYKCVRIRIAPRADSGGYSEPIVVKFMPREQSK